MSLVAASRCCGSSFSTPSSAGMREKKRCSVLWATIPRWSASGSASIFFGESNRSTNQADEQSAKRSSSVTPKEPREASCSRTSGCVMRVGRWKAPRARSSLRSQPFARASPSAAHASCAASSASARSRSRSVGAWSSGHVSAESGRRRVQFRTSSGSKSACTSCQKGLASRGLPSSSAASRTR